MADQQLIARLKHYIAAGEAGTLVPQHDPHGRLAHEEEE